MSNLLNLYTVSKRLADAIKSGSNPQDYMIQNLIDALDNCKFDEIVVDFSEHEKV